MTTHVSLKSTPTAAGRKPLMIGATTLYLLILAATWLSSRIPLGASQSGVGPGVSPLVGMLAGQVGLILIPTLLFAALSRRPMRPTLKLHPLAFKSGLKCWLAGMAGWPAAVILGLAGQIIAGALTPAAESASPAAAAAPDATALLGLFAGIVLIAPLCEELLFRGLLLGAWQERLGRRAIWPVGALFALLHLAASDWLGAFFVGVTAGWVVLRTRSLWAGVLLHMGNNLLSGGLALISGLAGAAAQDADAGAASAAAASAAALPASEAEILLAGLLCWSAVALAALIAWGLLLRSIPQVNGPSAPAQRQA